MRILVIEDNRDIAANLFDFLEAKSHIVDLAEDGLSGLHLATTNTYDAIVLDVMLPGLDGFSVCRRLRQEAHLATPVLMLTARDSLDDKIAGLESGADDYVVKPFALREVETRLRTLARRAQGAFGPAVLALADLTFDTGTYQVNRNGRPLELPPIPLKLLEALLRATPRAVSRAELEQAVWGDSPPDSDALRAHMHILRATLDGPGEPPLLHTLRGIGYRLALDDAMPENR
ncbi:MAG: response regulator transcription factor [Sulfuricella sp.]|nr:response regulator transcription factor [Sulfuricella sp.]